MAISKPVPDQIQMDAEMRTHTKPAMAKRRTVLRSQRAPTRAPNAPEHSPLMQLPGELRNMILAMVLTHDDGIHVNRDYGWARRHFDTTLSQALDPMLTCKQLFRETRTLFFRLNEINVHVDLTNKSKIQLITKLLSEVPSALCSSSSRVILWPSDSTYAAHEPGRRYVNAWDAERMSRLQELAQAIRPFQLFLGFQISHHRWAGRDRHICKRDAPVSGDDCGFIKLALPIGDRAAASKIVDDIYHGKINALSWHRHHRMCTVRIELDKILEGLEDAHRLMLEILGRVYREPEVITQPV